MSENEQNYTKKAAGVITTAALASIFTYSFVMALPNTIINEVVNEWNLEGASEGLMSSLISIGFIFALIIIPLIQGRTQKVTILIAACLLQASLLFIGGLVPTFLMFGISCALLGFSGGFIDTNANSIIVDVRKSESPKFLGYLHGLFGVGSLIAPLLFLWLLLTTGNWRVIFYTLTAISMLTALLIFLITHGSGKKGEETSIQEDKMKFADMSVYLRNKRNIYLALAGIFCTLSLVGVIVWIVRYMTIRFDAGELGAISISAFWLLATVNRFAMSQIVKRAPMKFFALGATFYAVFLAIGIVSANPYVLCVMVGLVGFCGGHFIPVLVSQCAAGYEGKTSFTTSFIMFVMSGSRIVTPLLMAYVGTQISLIVGMIIPIAAALIAACFGILVLKAEKSQCNDLINESNA